MSRRSRPVRFPGRWCLTDETARFWGGADGKEPTGDGSDINPAGADHSDAPSLTYAAIATHLELNANTVKTWCRRARITPDPTIPPVYNPLGVWCLNCGTPITGTRPAKFCSQQCRRTWWHARPEKINRRAFYQFTCPHCGAAFSAYGNKHRVYCSHACYIRHRFGTKDGRP